MERLHTVAKAYGLTASALVRYAIGVDLEKREAHIKDREPRLLAAEGAVMKVRLAERDAEAMQLEANDAKSKRKR